MRGAGLNGAADMVERVRRAGGDLAFLGTRFIAFGDQGVSPAITDFLEQMIRATPIEVISEFFDELIKHDLRRALPVLAKVPVVIVSGGRDRLTPPHLMREIADAVTTARLVTLPEAGHVPMLERPDVVTAELRELMRTASAGIKEAPGRVRSSLRRAGRSVRSDYHLETQRQRAPGKTSNGAE
jgi:pimeloyl-ACP methyl ester carboxylesterase